jgi:PAS domain S-box-containing protein
MKKQKQPAGPARKSMRNGAKPYSSGRRERRSSPSTAVLRHTKTDLEQTIQRYVDLFDFAPIAYVSFDRVGRIEEINLAAVQLLGAPSDRLIGTLFALRVIRADARLFLNHLLRCRSSEARVETELHIKKRNGEIILAHLTSSPTSSSMHEGALLYQTAIVDLTERKRAEEAIRQSELRYRTLFDLVPAAVYTCDADGLIQEFNQRAVELWGREPKKNDPKEKFCGSLKMFFPDGRSMRHAKCPMARALKGETLDARDLEILIERPDGSRQDVIVNPRAFRNERGKIAGAINCLYDVTERKRAQMELEKAKGSLETRVRERTAEVRAANKDLESEISRRKGLEGQILEISDREQQRLGEELHDGLCQHLTAIGFMARAAALRLKDHRVFQVEDIEKIAGLINAAANDARNIARGLHRIDVDSAGFLDALRDLVDREIWKTPCRLEIKEPLDIEDDAAAAHLYRIAREAVINANKHAQAREIVVHLARSRIGIVLSVTDNGVGLPNKPNKTRGLGFRIMNYRAQAAGGRLKVTRQPSGGTRVACYLPNPK